MSSFAFEIRRLFRDQDVEEMSFAFDVSCYEDVRDNADAIAERLGDGSMPCDEPWPKERIELFRKWDRRRVSRIAAVGVAAVSAVAQVASRGLSGESRWPLRR